MSSLFCQHLLGGCLDWWNKGNAVIVQSTIPNGSTQTYAPLRLCTSTSLYNAGFYGHRDLLALQVTHRDVNNTQYFIPFFSPEPQ